MAADNSLLFIYPLILVATSLAFPAGQGEYCGWDVFNAKCADGEMIVVENATYGRMRIGRCVRQEFGYLGCGKSVLPQLHRLCSGRQECQFTVSTLHKTLSPDCPADLSAYMQAQYSCFKAVTCESSQCQKSDFLKVTSPQGFLSSEVTWRTGCGTTSCPWLIEAEKGQRINISLFDFSQGAKSVKPTKICYKYATIQEDNSITKDITVCSETPLSLESHAFLSDSNRVSVALYTAADEEELHHFALKYNVLGCPQIQAPRYGTIRKDGHHQVTILCNHSDISWKLTCNGNAWVGEMGSCYDDTMTAGGLLSSSANQTFGMLLIIGLGVGIGVVVGGLLLTLSLVYLGRRRRSHTAQQVTETRLLDSNGLYADSRYIREANKDIPLSGVKIHDDYPIPRDHKYSINAPIRQVSCGPCDNHFGGQNFLDDDVFPPPPPELIKEHIYETPNFPIHDFSVIREIRPHSVDGIARKSDFDDGRSNRTN